MRRKVFLVTFVTILLSTLIAGIAFAATSYIKLIMNGQEIKTDVQPFILEDRVMVPIRAIAENLGANVTWDEEANSVIIMNKDKISKTIVDIPEEGIVLSAIEKEGMYKNFVLDVKGHKRIFDWKNVINPTYAPKLYLNDLDYDGQREMIVILTTAYGTGCYITEAYILNTETLIETYIDNPKAIVLKNVKTNIVDDKVEININGQKTEINIESIEHSHLFSNVTFENIRNYEVINDELIVNVGAQITPAYFIGDVQITYKLKDNMYQASKIEFKEYIN